MFNNIISKIKQAYISKKIEPIANKAIVVIEKTVPLFIKQTEIKSKWAITMLKDISKNPKGYAGFIENNIDEITSIVQTSKKLISNLQFDFKTAKPHFKELQKNIDEMIDVETEGMEEQADELKKEIIELIELFKEA